MYLESNPPNQEQLQIKVCLLGFPSKHVPSLKFTARTWKWMVGTRSFPFWGNGPFSGALAVSFRECNNPGGDWHPALGDEPMTDESSADTERWAPALAQQAAALRREMSSTGLRLLHGDASLCMEVAKSNGKNVGKTMAKWWLLTDIT